MAKDAGPKIVLQAAYNLTTRGEAVFSGERLVIEAWTLAPDLFGMTGYKDIHPNANKVLALLMGRKRGLVFRGLLAKPKPGHYALTALGKQRVEFEPDDDSPKRGQSVPPRRQQPAAPPQPLLNAATSRDLQRLLATKAFEYSREQREKELRFEDACGFWDVSLPPQGAGRVLEAVAAVEAGLASLAAVLGDDSRTLPNGQSVDSADVVKLRALNQKLTTQFARHIKRLAVGCKSY